MNQLDLSYYSKKDLPNILVYIELILTVFLPSFRMKDYMTNYRNFDIPKLPVISYFSFSLSVNTQFRAYPFYKASEWMPHKKLLLNSIVF